MAKTLAEWAKTQVRKPTDKISALDKLRAPFIINQYETWGELYDAVNIKPPVKKPKQVKVTIKGRTKEDISNEIDTAYADAEYARMQIQGLKTTDPDYAENKKLFDDSSKKLKDLRAEYASFEAKEDSKKLQDEIVKKKDEIKKKEDLGEDPTKAKAALKKLEETKAATDKKILAPKATTARTADEARAQAKKGQTPTPTSTPTPTPTPTPAPGPNKTPTPGDKPEKTKTASELKAEALNVAAGQDFALPETLFKNIPSLNTILKKYVAEKWTPDKLRKAIRDDVWYKQNSAEIKARYVQYYNYRDLQASGRATGSTDYEMQIAKIESALKKRAVEIGSAAANDPAALRQAAENLYITNRSEDKSFITDFLAASIKPVAGMIGGKVTQGYSGEALANYDKLVEAARDNGFQVSDILPGGTSEQQVLQGIVSGNIDVNRVIADARKLAAQGQPAYVRDLLAQGYNLKQVFAPYRQVMANVLEIGDPNQIDLNDPVLRSAITEKGDMNLFDFKRQLRQDQRWQYTAQAREDVSTAAFQVLRDFGFQG